MRIGNDDLLTIDGVTAAVSLGASANMKPTWLGHIANYAIQIVYTGTPAGDFKLQASCDEGSPTAPGDAAKYASVTHWTDIANTSTAAGGAAGNIMWNVENSGYQWVRVVYTRTSSTGSVTSARCTVKGV